MMYEIYGEEWVRSTVFSTRESPFGKIYISQDLFKLFVKVNRGEWIIKLQKVFKSWINKFLSVQNTWICVHLLTKGFLIHWERHLRTPKSLNRISGVYPFQIYKNMPEVSFKVCSYLYLYEYPVNWSVLKEKWVTRSLTFFLTTMALQKKHIKMPPQK